MFKKALVLLIGAFIFNPGKQASAQADHLIEIGEVDSVYSDILKESREIFVQIPESFEAGSQQKYPVLYVLDGETLLNAAATVYDFYWGGYMPEMIIIGISNRENRTRDLTPSDIKLRHGQEFKQEHGGADDFTAFIEKELIPFVENKYPATTYRTLIGHSFGGLFTINTLINHSSLFANYLAIDPSLDWDDQLLLKQAREALSKENLHGKSLYITMSGQLHMQNSAINLDNVMEDTSEYTLFSRSIIEFYHIAGNNPGNGLNIQWKFYPDDLHGTVPLPSILDGLIALFSWFQMEHTDKFNNPETPLDELLQVISYREKKLEEHLGYFVPPYEEDLLNMLGYMSMDMGLLEKSLAFFELGIKYYPYSANAYDSMADYYAAQNDFESALNYVSKAFDISGKKYHKDRMDTFKTAIISNQ